MSFSNYVSSSYFLLFLILSLLFLLSKKTQETLAIPAGTLITLAKEMIDTPPLVADKTVISYQNNHKQQCICLVFYSLFLFLQFMS